MGIKINPFKKKLAKREEGNLEKASGIQKKRRVENQKIRNPSG